LERALAHPSYVNESGGEPGGNQRLEFLGDAVLGLVSGELLYKRFPGAREGRLTLLRSFLVRRKTLARFAREAGIDQVVRVGVGVRAIMGRIGAKILEMTFEAVVGALHLDQGLAAARDYVLPFFDRALREMGGSIETVLESARSRFQKRVQAARGPCPTYRTLETRGEDFEKVHVVAVYVGGIERGRGEGPSKKSAAQAAAAAALERMDGARDF
jgi:ribonuclease-3